MSKEELNILTDEAIVMMAQEGSSTAYEYLIDKYRGLAKLKAHEYYIIGGDNDDVMQEGMIGIFKAVRDYDPNQGTAFKTFLNLCVERQIQTAITGANRQKHKILNESISLSVEEPIGERGENSMGLAEKIVDSQASDPAEMTVLKDTMQGLTEPGYASLSAFEQKVWAELLHGKNYKEIAKTLGRSPKTIDNAIQRIKKKIRDNLLDY